MVMDKSPTIYCILLIFSVKVECIQQQATASFYLLFKQVMFLKFCQIETILAKKD